MKIVNQNKGVESPCSGVCRYQKDEDICIGCYRSKEEILSWRDSKDSIKQKILIKVKERRRESDLLYTKDLLGRVLALPKKISLVVSFSP